MQSDDGKKSGAGLPGSGHLNGGRANGVHHEEEDATEREGRAEEVGAREEEDVPPHPAPAAVAELAASCARFVHAKYKVPLDGTSDTLSLLDQYVRDARQDLVATPEG